MKPLAHWAIHRRQKLRLQGRTPGEIWGHLVAPDGATRPFRYDRARQRLTIEDPNDPHTIQLDAYGFELP